MNKLFLRFLQWSMAVADLFVINAVFFVVAACFPKPYLDISDIQYLYCLVLINITWLAIIFVTNIYKSENILSFEPFTRGSMHAYVYFVLLVSVLLFFLRLTLLSRPFLVIVLGGMSAGLLLNRFLYLAVSHYFRRRDWLMDKVLIIGYNPLSKQLAGRLDDSINKKIIGFCEEAENISELSGYPILSDIRGAADVCRAYGINEIYSTIAPEHNDLLYDLISMSERNCIRFKIVPDLSLYINKHMYVDYLEEIPVFSLRKEPLEDLGNRVKKRAFDLVVSSVFLLLILSWLTPLIALLIWLDSRGSSFFLQARTGRNNKSFMCIKFRSMRPSVSAGILQASRGDARITRVGRFLRRTSLDELPQFLNVFKGDMSIVGPRPHMLKHTDEYAPLIDRYMVRQFLKPGVTGWAQVHGFRGETKTLWPMQQRVEHDLWYMEHWSFFLDIKIVFMTALMAIKGDKNAF
jgi:putative colanic acid biosynthesis UDP-glucose lipid carrier transferase